jgi:hypothetical protein
MTNLETDVLVGDVYEAKKHIASGWGVLILDDGVMISSIEEGRVIKINSDGDVYLAFLSLKEKWGKVFIVVRPTISNDTLVVTNFDIEEYKPKEFKSAPYVKVETELSSAAFEENVKEIKAKITDISEARFIPVNPEPEE